MEWGSRGRRTPGRKLLHSTQTLKDKENERSKVKVGMMEAAYQIRCITFVLIVSIR